MSKSKLTPLAIFIMSSGMSSHAVAKDNLVWVEYPESGVVLGQGYDLLEDRPSTGTCVDFVPIQDPSQSIQYKFDEVTSQTQVQSVTNISASGSMKMAILKASARLSFLSDETFKLETQKFLLSANVVNSSLFAAPSVDFKRGGAVVRQPVGRAEENNNYLLSTKIGMKSDADRLNVEKCGQGFVSAIVSGASLDAFLTMAKTTAKSLAEIKGGLEADIGGIFTVSGSFEQKQTSAAAQQNTTVSVYKTGGTSSKIAYDLAGLKASVAAMPLEAATAPKPIRIAVLPYEYLDDTPEKKSYTAQLYGQAVAAYFLVKDVFERSADVIDRYDQISEVPKDGQPLFIKDIEEYLQLNARALLSANRLSTVLEVCQEEVARVNDALVEAGSGAAAIPPATALFSALGAPPSDEGQRPNSRPFAERAQVSKQLDTQYSAFNASMYVAIKSTTSTAASPPTDRLSHCSPDNENAYLRGAVDEAIGLASEELSVRPIFWSELGINYQEKLRPIIAKVGGSDTVESMTLEAVKVFDEYTRLHRSSRLVRDICDKTFTHPICATDQLQFIERSRMSVAEGEIKFTQMAHDGK